jgi:hypothetical protein
VEGWQRNAPASRGACITRCCTESYVHLWAGEKKANLLTIPMFCATAQAVLEQEIIYFRFLLGSWRAKLSSWLVHTDRIGFLPGRRILFLHT